MSINPKGPFENFVEGEASCMSLMSNALVQGMVNSLVEKIMGDRRRLTEIIDERMSDQAPLSDSEFFDIFAAVFRFADGGHTSDSSGLSQSQLSAWISQKNPPDDRLAAVDQLKDWLRALERSQLEMIARREISGSLR